MSTHTRTATELGPDYCWECSADARDWVMWPCEPSKLGDDGPVWVGRENYTIGVTRFGSHETIIVSAGDPKVERIVPLAGERYAFERVVWQRRVEVTVSPSGRARVWVDGREVRR